MVQCVRNVQLEYVPSEEERQEVREAAPHPRVEALYRNVHVMPRAERF